MKRTTPETSSELPNKYGRMSRETELVSIFGRASELINEMLNDRLIEHEKTRKLVSFHIVIYPVSESLVETFSRDDV